MIKRELMFVSSVQDFVLLDFISQSFAFSQNLQKLSLSKISLQKLTNLYFFFNFYIFKLLLKFYAQFYLILNYRNRCNNCTIVTIMRVIIEKEIALPKHEIMVMHKHIIVRQLIYSYKTFLLFTRGLFKL